MSIRKRKKQNGKTSYYVTVYGKPDESGKRPRRYGSASTLAEARQLEADMVAEMRACDSPCGAITLEQYIRLHYWPSALSRLAPSSLDTYEQNITRYIVPNLGDMKLREIDRAAVQHRMVDNCANSGIACRAVSVLKTILNEAIHDGLITLNPACANYALPTQKPHKRDNGLVLQSFDEIFGFLDIVANSAPVPLQRIAYTGLLQGLRPEERYALDWSCFDLSTRTITINRAFTHASRKHGGGQPKATKTEKSTRVIPMHPAFFDFLIFTPSPAHDGAFILGAGGQRITPPTAQHQWSRFLRAHPECPPLTIENMRHSFATAYLAAGGQIEVLSRILGHANISTTIDRYYRPDVELLRGDFEAVAEKSRISQQVSASFSRIKQFDSPRLHHSE